MTNEERRYLAYLLRLWQTEYAGRLIWRTSLESPHTGHRQGFANLAELVDFLKKQLGEAVDEGPPAEDG